MRIIIILIALKASVFIKYGCISKRRVVSGGKYGPRIIHKGNINMGIINRAIMGDSTQGYFLVSSGDYTLGHCIFNSRLH